MKVTRNVAECTRRRRYCKKCKAKWTTYEIDYKTLKAYSDAADSMEQIKQLLAQSKPTTPIEEGM